MRSIPATPDQESLLNEIPASNTVFACSELDKKYGKMATTTETMVIQRHTAHAQSGSTEAIELQPITRSTIDRASDEPFPERQVEPDDEWDQKGGWPAVAAGSAIFFVYLGLVYSYGIVQLHLSEAKLASVSTLSFIGSVGAAMSPFAGMITARIISRFGYMKTACAGGIFLGLGEFTAGFSTKSVPAMFMTQGVIFGIGAALLFLVSRIYPFWPYNLKKTDDHLSLRPLCHPCGSKGNED